MQELKHPNQIEFQVTGDYAMFSDPVTRMGGESWFRRHLRPSVSAILKPRIGCGKIFSQQHVLLFKSTAMIFTRRSA